MKYTLSEDVEKYLTETQEELLGLIKDLCRIPAPSHKEQNRAAFCKKWLQDAGAKGVYIDEALNVVYPIACDKGSIVVFMAHTDTVFPDLKPMPMTEKDGKLYCPGVCDDTANLAVLMMMAKYVTQRGLEPKQGLLFVANSCEEGLGNLKGSRQIMKDYGERIQAVFSFDGGYTGISNNAVGSTRYRVEVKTEGGHSYGSFGNRNAIAYLASMIQTLYNMKVPTKAKTTFNVGMVSGGTSVNTIAQQAEMLYEYRSEDRACLAVMERMFGAVVEAYRAMDIEVNVEILGQRPCKGDVDETEQERLTKKCLDIVTKYVGSVPECSAGSTDCNIPLSMGIPAVCVGVCHGQGAHTREEWLEISSLKAGSRVGAALILDYFNV